MKRAVVIGGKGKVGTYLVPMLCRAGYEVVNVSRGVSEAYIADDCWRDVRQLTLERNDARFAPSVAALEPEVVVDMICFRESDMLDLAAALDGRCGHYLACGSIWCHGYTRRAPMGEDECRDPFDEYGIQKDKMERTLARLFAERGFPGTIVHPGHIVGPGHRPINPQGNGNNAVFAVIKRGEALPLPNLGMETLHHVHASDIAGVFMAAIRAGQISCGEGFHAVSPHALTLRGFAEAVAGWYGVEPNLRFLSLDAFRAAVGEEDAAVTLEHITRSPNCSMEKAKRLLGFAPRYESLDAVRESLDWLEEHGRIQE